MSQVIVLKNGKQATELVCVDGTVEITENGHICIEYHALMDAIRKFAEEEYKIDMYV